jgi:hypothetical protein
MEYEIWNMKLKKKESFLTIVAVIAGAIIITTK